MRPACWDALMWGLTQLAADHPEQMSLTRRGDRHEWRNDLLGVRHTFRYGNDESLPTDRRHAVEHPDEAGTRLYLRVEVQHFVRLAPSNAVLFPIRTYLLPFAELALVPEWARRFAAVLAEPPDDMAEYKWLARYRDVAVDWLRATSAG